MLIVSAPLLALVAIAIKLTSRGPVFFSQERLGRGGRRFRILKFRTMQTDAEQVLRSDDHLYRKFVANDFKLPENEDFRITWVGRLLRKTSLDEFPQLVNVLKGDMSLVGPRPIESPHIAKYGDFGDLLLTVKPGLTGYWQINGRSEVSHPSRMVMELEYIRNQSLSRDIDILIR